MALGPPDMIAMKLGSKIVAIGGVLLAGTVAVVFFRKPAVTTPQPAATVSNLPLRDGQSTRPVVESTTPQGVPLPSSTPASASEPSAPAPVTPIPPAPVSRAPSGPIIPGKSTLPPAPLPPTFHTDAGSVTGATPSAKSAPLPDLRGSSSISPPKQAIVESAAEATKLPRSSETIPALSAPKPVSPPPANTTRNIRPAPWRSHTVVDGDTLSALATRYLGSAGRYAEILDANRQALRSPDMLPIGTVLRIPPPSAPDAAPAENTAVINRLPNLVPIPQGALKSEK